MKDVPTESISGQDTGGTQERLLIAASSRTWQGSGSPAAPGLPRQVISIPDVRPSVNAPQPNPAGAQNFAWYSVWVR